MGLTLHIYPLWSEQNIALGILLGVFVLQESIDSPFLHLEVICKVSKLWWDFGRGRRVLAEVGVDKSWNLAAEAFQLLLHVSDGEPALTWGWLGWIVLSSGEDGMLTPGVIFFSPSAACFSPLVLRRWRYIALLPAFRCTICRSLAYRPSLCTSS